MGLINYLVAINDYFEVYFAVYEPRCPPVERSGWHADVRRKGGR